jgi:hypothetical protein
MKTDFQCGDNESGGSIQGEMLAFPAKEDGSIPIPPLQLNRSSF